MRTIGLLTSLLVTFVLYAAVWTGYSPKIDTVDTAIWNVFAVAMMLLIYVWIQAAAAHSPPENFNIWWALDIAFSVLPLFTAGVALLANMNFDLPLDAFQLALIILVATAATIDLLLIYVFFREHKRPHVDTHAAKDAPRRP